MSQGVPKGYKFGPRKRPPPFTAEHLLAMSLAQKGKKRRPETIAALSASLKGNQNARGFKHPPEFGRAISLREKGNTYRLGKHNSEAHNLAIGNINRGKVLGPLSEETKEKLRRANIGRKHRPETLALMRSPEHILKRAMGKALKFGRADGPVCDTKPEKLFEKNLVNCGVSVVTWKGDGSHQSLFDASLKMKRCLKQVPMYGTIVDYYFIDTKTVIFVDGCWWHGHSCSRNSYRDNLSAKQVARQKKDRDQDKRLLDSGHKVVRVWECEIC